MAEAAAKGRMDEYISENFGESGNARRLLEMMMGMTGMAPPQSRTRAVRKGKSKDAPTGGKANVPKDVLAAASCGNVGELMNLLKREQENKSGRKEVSPETTVKEGKKTVRKKTAQDKDQGFIEKQVLDQLINIASENNVTVDWLISRAISLYVRDYRTTGRM